MDELTRIDEGSEKCSGLTRNSFPPEDTDVVSKNHRGKPIDFSFQIADSENVDMKEESANNINLLRSNLSSSYKTNYSSSPVALSTKFFKRIIRKIKGNKTIEILYVINTCQIELKDFQWGWINPPRKGDEINGFSIPIGGWVLGKKSQPTVVQFLVNKTVFAETPINIYRPDVVKAYFTKYSNCGFDTTLDLEQLPITAEIRLQAVFPEGHTAVIGSIKFRKFA